MNTTRLPRLLLSATIALLLGACARQDAPAPAVAASSDVPAKGQASVSDDLSQKDIVKVAVGSKDHSTLVAAVQAAGLVDVLANAGPFTVFAPTNDAFKKLPAGTVENLLKPANKDALINILEYHVAVAIHRPEMLKDGLNLEMVNGGHVKFSVKDGKVVLNGTATVVASVSASNGIIHVIDGVITPPAKK